MKSSPGILTLFINIWHTFRYLMVTLLCFNLTWTLVNTEQHRLPKLVWFVYQGHSRTGNQQEYSWSLHVKGPMSRRHQTTSLYCIIAHNAHSARCHWATPPDNPGVKYKHTLIFITNSHFYHDSFWTRVYRETIFTYIYFSSCDQLVWLLR